MDADDNINKSRAWGFLDAPTIDAIRKRYVAGDDVPDIMAAYGITRRTMAKIVKRGKWFKARQASKFSQSCAPLVDNHED